MKPEADRLTQWATDAITFDLADGPGILRVYTRTGFELLSTTLTRLATRRIHEMRDQMDRSKTINCKMPIPTSDEEERDRLRALNPDLGDHVVTAPMLRLAEAFGRFGVLLTDDRDPRKDIRPAAILETWLAPKKLLAFDGIKDVQTSLDQYYIQLFSQALKATQADQGQDAAADRGMQLMGFQSH